MLVRVIIGPWYLIDSCLDIFHIKPMSNTVLFLLYLVSVSNPVGDASVVCWWLCGWRRWYGQRVDPLQHDTYHITIFSWNYFIGSVWHSGSVEGPDWDAQWYGAVHLGSGAEEVVISGKRIGRSPPLLPAPMGAPWRWWNPLNNRSGWSRRKTSFGRSWWRTCTGIGRFGLVCRTSSGVR